MKFSLEWLRYFLDTDASVQEIAGALNRMGNGMGRQRLRCGGIKRPAIGFADRGTGGGYDHCVTHEYVPLVVCRSLARP